MTLCIIRKRLTYINFPSFYWYSKSKIYPKISLYKNTNLDLLIEKGQRLPNGIERKELYQTIHKIIYNNQPACFLFFSSDFGAISRRFQNTDVYFFHSMPTYAIKDFYVETERR